jgi:tRNA (cmo5U34)-methyltransferase
MTLDRVREHFEQEAREFDDLIVRLIPRYDEMLDAMIAALPFPTNQPLRVIDLGCGTGTVALRVKQRFPCARITCLDLAENMLVLARAKLASCDGIEFEQGDFLAHPFKGPYDAAVSSLALHHLQTDDDKRNFYRRLYAALPPGGVFWTADAALGANPAINKLYMEKWKEYMRRSMTERQIEERFAKDAQEDRPATLADHFRWMEAAGFVAPEVIWKYFYCGVYGAHKPA